jgi:hypothetical protein
MAKRVSAFYISSRRNAVFFEKYTGLPCYLANIRPGIDAFYPEPLPSEHPLLTNPRVTFSPHVAGTTKEASLLLARSAADQILAALRGDLPAFPVNKTAWEGSRSRRPRE